MIIESLGTSSQPSRLILLSVDGKQRRFLASAVEHSGDIAPALSPDGQLLAFLRWVRTRGTELRVMPALGTNRRYCWRGTAVSSAVGSPGLRTAVELSIVPRTEGCGKCHSVVAILHGWESVATRRITRQSRRVETWLSPEPANQVALISATLPQLGQGPVAFRELFSWTQTVLYPQWSSDGKQIAFCSNRSGSTEIWRSDADGGSLAQLTSGPGRAAANPRWSPDGKTIAFDAGAAGNSDIYLTSTSGGVAQRLTTESSMDTHAAWSNDGETISSSDRSGTSQVWKMPVAGGPASQVTTDGGYFPAISADRHLYFLKTRWSKTVWRMPLGGGRSEVVLDGGPQAPRLWTPTAEGVYYLDRTALRYFNVRSRRHSEALLQFQPTEISVMSTIGASPDGRSILIPRFRQSGTDVMLVERFW